MIAAIAMCMLFLMPPNIVVSCGNYDILHFFRLAQYVCVAVAFAAYLIRGRHTSFSVLVLLYAVFGLVTTVAGGGPILGGVRSLLPTVAAILLAYSLADRHRAELLWGVLWICSLLTLVNVVVTLIVPIGTPLLHELSTTTFLGNRNSFSRYYLSALFASALLDHPSGRLASPRTIAILVLSVVQSVLAFSSTSFVELVFVAVGYCMIRNQRLRKVLTASMYAVVCLAFFFLFVIFRVQGLFGIVIEGVFGKRLDFSGRTDIWDKAIEAMDGEHLLLGYYKGHSTPLGLVLGEPCWTAHNAILDLLVWGGLIALILVLGFVGVVCWRLFETRGMRLSAVYSLCLGANFIGGLMESIMFPYFGFFVGLAYADPLLRTGDKPSGPHLRARVPLNRSKSFS
ncbi:O-antigen ligase family protein [Adlercreutzia shanghongiae]|uniref:O-antigen ligase family protein n=1 Tax=Adlercreutzia shanghongiae TaxID=3111773 RepID=A0ABU6J064_9ACTN|nr:O-antigen ligase family protein [Adlercreutzia sp. R22]MEC4295534.1 O-antigen ligase family protein [Adlercreutzia sp. R22]